MSYTLRDRISDTQRKALNEYSELVANLLVSRGVTSASEADLFLHPDYENGLHDPLLLKDITKSSDRVLKAIEDKETIAIYSDYDADGIPGAVVLSDYFKKVGHEQVVNYIPHRNKEGFGVHAHAIEKLSEEDGVTLVITIDCGIGDTAAVQRANELGVDVIITDHHLAHGDIPKALAIVNPNQPGCEYPNKDLCGSGVIYKLVQVLLERGDHVPAKGWDKWLLDMVGLATVADMVSLTGENRILASFGLVVLRKSRRPGLQQLLKKIKVDQRQITEGDIGFMIAPRINAASRMGVPIDAFKLLSVDDPLEAGKLVTHLDSINTKRKTLVAQMTKEIKKRIALQGEPHAVIVMGNPEWKPSLAGLAANSLMEEYKRPVFVWGRDEAKVIKGSCRSDGSVHLVELMEVAKESFIAFGGHECSGGFSVELDSIHRLEENLLTALTRVDQAETAKEVFIDAELSLDDITWNTFNAVNQLAPFGMDNPKPLFMFRNSPIASFKQFGNGDAHLEVSFARNNGSTVSSIAFFTEPEGLTKAPNVGEKGDVIGSLEASYFRGRPELRLRLVDIL